MVPMLKSRFRRSTSLLTQTLKKSFCTLDRKSTRLNSSHSQISYAVFCLKKKKIKNRKIIDSIVVLSQVISDHYLISTETHPSKFQSLANLLLLSLLKNKKL